VGLIDDEAFAEAFAEQAVSGRKGPRAIANGLYAKGVDRATIDRALAASSEGEFDRALEFAQGRARRLTGVPGPKAFQRLSAALMRRGFDPETSRAVARKALEVDPADEP
jgi:regulatory protein